MNIKRIEKSLQGLKTVSKIFYFDQLPSTNDYAKELIKDKVISGTVIIVKNQTKGRGSRGRKWGSKDGQGVYLSIILKPEIDFSNTSFLTIISGIAVAIALREISGVKAEIKWPNDVLVNNKKIAGILTEGAYNKNSLEYIIVGIGININIKESDIPLELKNIATSLSMITDAYYSLTEIIILVLREFEKLYNMFNAGNIDFIIHKWKSLSSVIGKKIKVNSGNETYVGTALDINEKGYLILETETKEIKEIFSGEVN